jgi:DNA-binding NtrC family response regulator
VEERPTFTNLSTVGPTPPDTADAPSRLYVMVVDGESSWMQPLPRDGAVVIGRVAGCDLQLKDASVSRQHARLEMRGGRATVIDLGSQNGTLVNNLRITERELVAGDVLTIGSAVLVYHASAAAGATPLVGFAELRAQLGRELDRVIHFGRELAVVCVDTRPESRIAADAAVRRALRRLDVAALSDDGEIWVVMPETGDGVAGVVARLVEGDPRMRAGYAAAPRDGCDADALIGGARAAAQAAAWGEVSSASGAMRELELGDRTAVIADPAMARVYALVERLAASELPVLVYGETGTGKELVAAALHQLSPRKDKPRVAVNCAALAENLVESELFGHERGAFSGAVAAKPGIFELARGGTVFLDEIGELSATVQAKLLRVLETKRVMRVGDVREIAVDMRLVSATNRDLKEEIKAGRFRQDLYFRLSGATVWLPPLRDRLREVPILTHRFLAAACAQVGRAPLALAASAMQRFATYPWPGNVRELKNVCDYLAATVAESEVEDWHLDDVLGGARDASDPDEDEPKTQVRTPVPQPTTDELPRFQPLGDEVEELERRRIGEAMRATGGNQTRAARLISVPLRTFLTKLKKYGIS